MKPNQNCSESCGCKEESIAAKKSKTENQTKFEEKPQAAADKKPALDPVHFGDWQVNCRTIDF